MESHVTIAPICGQDIFNLNTKIDILNTKLNRINTEIGDMTNKLCVKIEKLENEMKSVKLKRK